MAKKYLLTILLLGAWAETAAAQRDLSPFVGRVITQIELSGNRFTRDYVILRELRLQVGHPFDPRIVEGDLQRLDNLDIFSSAEVLAAADGDGVALKLKVREVPPLIPYVSYDVTDEDGWSFGPAIKSVNMLGMDIYVAGFALFGGKTLFLLDLSNPWIREYSLWGQAADLGLAGAFFADTGLAWSRGADFALGRSRTGFGLGLRLLLLAVDMTRFDLGFDEDGNWRLHFAVFSKMQAQRLRLR